jgi:hypothetical protein
MTAEARLIDTNILVHAYTATEMGICYPERRLANRRLDRIVCEIGAILSGETKMVGKNGARKE